MNNDKIPKAAQLVAAGSAIAFAVVTVIAFVALGGGSAAPGIGASPAKIAEFYLAHHAKEAAAGDLLPLVAALLMIFTAVWRPLIRDPRGVWSALFFGGGLVAATGFTVAGVAQLALANGADHHFAAATLQALNGLAISSGLGFTAGIGMLLLGAAGCLIPSTGILKVAGWIAIPLGVINLTPAGVAIFPVDALWIVAVGILLALQPRMLASHKPVAATA